MGGHFCAVSLPSNPQEGPHHKALHPCRWMRPPSAGRWPLVALTVRFVRIAD